MQMGCFGRSGSGWSFTGRGRRDVRRSWKGLRQRFPHSGVSANDES